MPFLKNNNQPKNPAKDNSKNNADSCLESHSLKEGESAIALEYKLSLGDIFWLILRIHGILIVLPISFMIGYLTVLISDRYVGWELYVYFGLFCLAVMLVIYVFLSQYFVFKKLFYFTDSSIAYHAEFLTSGLLIYQGSGKNQTEYDFQSFTKGRETKKCIYLYFRYDRALIIKKQFISGNETLLRSYLKDNIQSFKPLRS